MKPQLILAGLLASSVSCVLVSCVFGSDPYSDLQGDECRTGNLRNGDSACVLAVTSVAADGLTDDWALVTSAPLNSACAGADCPPLPAELRMTQFNVTDPADETERIRMIGLRVLLQGGAQPIEDDESLRYVIHMRDASAGEEDAMQDELIASNGDYLYRKNGHVVSSAFATIRSPHELVATSDGLEATVRREFLSFLHGFEVTVDVQRRVGDQWESLVSERVSHRGCWSEDALLSDPCAGWQR